MLLLLLFSSAFYCWSQLVTPMLRRRYKPVRNRFVVRVWDASTVFVAKIKITTTTVAVNGVRAATAARHFGSAFCLFCCSASVELTRRMHTHIRHVLQFWYAHSVDFFERIWILFYWRGLRLFVYSVRRTQIWQRLKKEGRRGGGIRSMVIVVWGHLLATH